jgi:hypothetical protein
MIDIQQAIKSIREEAVAAPIEMSIPKFVGMLFYYRDMLHLCHLNIESYSAHKALNSLYNSILDFTDDLVETSQTQELLEISIPSSSSSKDAISLVENLLSFVKSNRYVFPYSFQQNILDEIESVASKTIYKLKFLK